MEIMGYSGAAKDSSALLMDQLNDIVFLLKRQLHDAHNKITALQEKKDQEVADKTKGLSEENADLRRRISALEDQLRSDRSVQEDKVDVVKDQLVELRNEIRDRDARIQGLEEQLKRDRFIFERTLKVVREQQQESGEQQRKTMAVVRDAEHLKELLAESEKTIKKLRTQLDEQRASMLADIEAERMRHRQELFVLQRAVDQQLSNH
jgi:chromosome segregation ATPase